MTRRVREPPARLPTGFGGSDKQERPLPGSRCKEGSGLESVPLRRSSNGRTPWFTPEEIPVRIRVAGPLNSVRSTRR